MEQAYAADSTPSYIARECCEKLKELYKKTGNQEHYLQMLWDLALTIHVANIDLYRELKSQYKPEEWREQREKILTSWGALPPVGSTAIRIHPQREFSRRAPSALRTHRHRDCRPRPWPSELRQNRTDSAQDETPSRRVALRTGPRRPMAAAVQAAPGHDGRAG